MLCRWQCRKNLNCTQEIAASSLLADLYSCISHWLFVLRRSECRGKNKYTQKTMWAQIKQTIFKKDANTLAAFKTAVQMHQSGDLAGAEIVCSEILAQEPDNVEALQLAATIKSQQANFDDAEALIRRAIELSSSSPAVLLTLAKILFNSNRIDESLLVARSATSADAPNADAHVHLGIAFMYQANLHEAVQHFREAVRLNSGNAEIWLQLGNIHFRQKDFDQAADCFAKALQNRPDYVEALHNLGLALREMGNLEEAKQRFTETVKSAPKNIAAHVALGDTLMRQGRFDEAVVHYRNALALDPGNPDRLFAVGLAFSSCGKFSEAAEYYRRTIECNPAHAKALCNLGLAVNELGKAHEAEDFLRQAAAVKPDDKFIAANLRAIVANKVHRWHFSMMNDMSRNTAYENAILAEVRSEDHVLEIGTGSGLLSMMAARAGAKHVTTCEMITSVAAKARQIIEKNGYSEKITVLDKRSTLLQIPDDLPEKGDVLVSEIVSSDLLAEGILGTIEDAKSRLLKSGARIIPSGASIVARLAGARELDQYVAVGTVAGFNLEDFNEFSPITVEPAEMGVQVEFYSESFDVFNFDFVEDDYFPSGQTRIPVTCTSTGLCYGVLQWIRLRLNHDFIFENSPENKGASIKGGHWRHTLFMFATPLMVQEGQTLNLVAAHNRSGLTFCVESVG
jgi:protein arginine N-methyltransferase 7